VLLLEAADRVLTGFPPSLSAKAARALESDGVTLLLNHAVTDIQEGKVTITTPGGGSEQHAARTVIWAAGVTPSSLAGALARASDGEVDRVGRLIVEPDLSLPGHPEVLAIGDMIAIRRNGKLKTLPGVAPVAMQEGRHAARVVLAKLRGRESRPFHYFDKGNLATIGRRRAVADLHVVRYGGTLAWITWLGVHLFYLIGFQNRVLVLTNWGFRFFTHGRGARLVFNQSPPTRETSQVHRPLSAGRTSEAA
jgi:NADH:quinone reductase (non-electrogenic)